MQKRLLGQFPAELNQMSGLMAMCRKLNGAMGTDYNPSSILLEPQSEIEDMLAVIEWQM